MKAASQLLKKSTGTSHRLIFNVGNISKGVAPSRVDIKLQPYAHGKGMTAASYINNLELYFSLKDVSQAQWANTLIYNTHSEHLRSQMKKVSATTADGVTAREPLLVYNEVKKLFLHEFAVTKLALQAKKLQLQECKKGVSEPIEVFLDRWDRAYQESNPEDKLQTEDKIHIVIRAFDRHIQSSYHLAHQLDEREPNWQTFKAEIINLFHLREPDVANQYARYQVAQEAALERVSERTGLKRPIDHGGDYSAHGAKHTSAVLLGDDKADSHAAASSSSYSNPFTNPKPSASALLALAVRTHKRKHEDSDADDLSHSEADTPVKAERPKSRFTQAQKDAYHAKLAAARRNNTNAVMNAANYAAANGAAAGQAAAAAAPNASTLAAASTAHQATVNATANAQLAARQLSAKIEPLVRVRDPDSLSHQCLGDPQACHLLGHSFLYCIRNQKGLSGRPEHAFRMGPHPNLVTRNAEFVKRHNLTMPPLQDRNNSNAVFITPVAAAIHASNSLFDVVGHIHGVKVPRMLLDSGSDSTLLRLDYFRQLPEAIRRSLRAPPSQPLIVANDVSVSPVGQCTLPLTLADRLTGKRYTLPVHFLIMEHLNCPSIVGRDNLSRFYSNISLVDNRLEFSSTLVPDGEQAELAYAQPEHESPLMLSHNTHIKPDSSQLIDVYFNTRILQGDAKRVVLCEPVVLANRLGVPIDLQFPAHLIDGAGAVPGCYSILVRNPTSHSITLPRDARIGIARAHRSVRMRTADRAGDAQSQ